MPKKYQAHKADRRIKPTNKQLRMCIHEYTVENSPPSKKLRGDLTIANTLRTAVNIRLVILTLPPINTRQKPSHTQARLRIIIQSIQLVCTV